MGINKSTIVNIDFDRPSLFYYGGEKVSGTILLHSDHKKIALNKVFLEFIGELGYTSKERDNIQDGMGYSQIEYHTVRHRIQFLTRRYAVISSKNNESELILNNGQYNCPFEFTLPELLPPSSSPSKGIYPYIKYYIRIVLDKPWYKSSLEKIFPLIISPRVDLYHTHEGRKSVIRSHRNRKNCEFKVYLHKRGVLPGQPISLDIDIENPQKSQIERVQATLIQHRNIVQHHHQEVIFQMNLTDLTNFNDTELHQTFDLQVPHGYLPPTCHYKAERNHSIILTEIYYELKLEVKVSGMLSNMNFSIPIVVATESLFDQNYRQTTDYDEMPISYAAAMKETELPPSYESVIENFKSQQLIDVY